MAIWRTRIACWITKATDTHSAYVTFIVIPLQQWLNERACVTLHVHCLSCYLVAPSHLAVVEAVAAFNVLNSGITVLFDVTHIESLVLCHSAAARNVLLLCPSYRHARYDATSIIASFSALSFRNKWLHPLPSTACLTVHSSCSHVLHKLLTVLSPFCHLCTTCTCSVVFLLHPPRLVGARGGAFG